MAATFRPVFCPRCGERVGLGAQTAHLLWHQAQEQGHLNTPAAAAIIDELAPAPIPPSALRTPALHPRTYVYLGRLQARLISDRITAELVATLRPAQRPIARIFLSQDHHRRVDERVESLYLNLTPARPLEPPDAR